MDRRDFISLSGAAALAAVAPDFATRASVAELSAPPADAPWRTFEVATDPQNFQYRMGSREVKV